MSQENQLWADLFPRKPSHLPPRQDATCLTHYEFLGGGGAVKVDSQWAIDTGLQPTQGYSLDGKSVYVVAMYHQLHCIVSCLSSEPGEFRTKIDGDLARP